MQNERPTVVVVNDNPNQLEILAWFLNKAGIASHAFESVEAALAAMDPAAPPDLIVTDLYMPGIDGWRFCRLLRSPEYLAFNAIPLLVVSATFAGDQPERIAADIGADAFLPIPVDKQEFVAQAQALLAGRAARPQPRVLIVEDYADLAEMLQEVFAAHGYRADTAASVRAAEAAFHKSPYDVAVMDYHLPDGKGDALLDAFQAKRPDCVCLMMTGDPTPELALAWMKRGASAYLRKPFEPELIIELCARARREHALLRAEELLEARTCELRESEAYHRALFESVSDAVLVHEIGLDGLPGKFVAANRVALEQLGYTSEELLKLTPRDIAADDAFKALAEVRANLANSGDSLFETVHRSRDGRRIPVESHVNVLELGGKRVAISVIRDLSERERAEADREKLQAQLTQAQKMESVGRLAGGVAHDFNNMLQAILGHADLVLQDLPSDNPFHDNLVEIKNCAQRSADLTRQLLAFARKQTIAPKVLDLNETIEGLLKMLRRLIGENIDLAWRPGRHLWPVRLDPSQVDQILANLCVNARDAIADVGQITLETDNTTIDAGQCAEHSGFTPGDYVMLAVNDNGCGMDAETLSHLFEPFFTTKEVGKGTGLGLATVYGAVKQNHGFINVHSEPGRGTTFKIYLPRHAVKDAQELDERKPHTTGRGSETILLVEDEPVILNLIQQMLEHLGYTVLTADTPGKAIRLATEHPGRIDLLLTDVVMPEMNGRDLARNILALHPNIKRLFSSGYTADVIAHQGVLDSGIHFIQKPFSPHSLAAKVREALEN